MVQQTKNRADFRLNRFLARAGIAARRKCDELIQNGLVSVNDKITTIPGFRVTFDDKVMCQGRRVRPLAFVTAVLNKPCGYETTLSPDSERSILQLIKGLPPGTVPVGRLDINTGGLLLLSNDGELVHRLTHPSWQVEREYILLLKAPPAPDTIKKLRKGIYLGRGEFSNPVSVKITGKKNINIVLHTGRNKEVRRLAEKSQLDLSRLERIRYGPVTLNGLERGSWRMLRAKELEKLKAAVDLD